MKKRKRQEREGGGGVLGCGVALVGVFKRRINDTNSHLN